MCLFRGWRGACILICPEDDGGQIKWRSVHDQSSSQFSTAGAIEPKHRATQSLSRASRIMIALLAKFPNTLIHTSGPFVGLPDGQMGNSEVGHMNIGAGRIVQMDITRIDAMIQSGEFARNKLLLDAMAHGRDHQLHLIGLLSDGGVHSHIEHLFALLRMAREEKVTRVFVHCFMDGRDTPPNSGVEFIEQLQHADARIRSRPDRERRRPLLRDGSR